VNVQRTISEAPDKFALEQNYPNPFNPTTHLRFAISDFRFVRLTVFDILGREVAQLVNGYKDAGKYMVVFNGSNLPSGVYIYRLESGKNIAVSKMILTK